MSTWTMDIGNAWKKTTITGGCSPDFWVDTGYFQANLAGRWVLDLNRDRVPWVQSSGGNPHLADWLSFVLDYPSGRIATWYCPRHSGVLFWISPIFWHIYIYSARIPLFWLNSSQTCLMLDTPQTNWRVCLVHLGDIEGVPKQFPDEHTTTEKLKVLFSRFSIWGLRIFVAKLLFIFRNPTLIRILYHCGFN